jgi:hypothetical protein
MLMVVSLCFTNGPARMETICRRLPTQSYVSRQLVDALLSAGDQTYCKLTVGLPYLRGICRVDSRMPQSLDTKCLIVELRDPMPFRQRDGLNLRAVLAF